MKRNLLLAITAITLGGLTTIVAPTTTNAATMPGSLAYHKTKMTAKIGSNYQSFKLTNHIINSNYKDIKTTSWQKSGLKKGAKVVIDMYATQGTQYNWYRISKPSTQKSQKKQKSQKYWVYGQALVLPKLKATSVNNN